MSHTIRPHHLNAIGPFYVVDGCCTACNVPFSEAPSLFAYDDCNHCYVKRQPQTTDELDGMLRAMWAAELQCIRYRGEEPEVLRRLGELGEEQLCDTPQLPSTQPILRRHVTFDARSPDDYALTPVELLEAFQAFLISRNRHWHSYADSPIVVDGVAAQLSYSWSPGILHPVWIQRVISSECRWLLWHSPIEQLGSRGVSHHVDDWLRGDSRFCNIRWFTEEEWNLSKKWQERPW